MKEAKLVRKKDSTHQSVVALAPGVECGDHDIIIIGGPCSVENMEQMQLTTKELQKAPVQAIRGGVYKPRTSPYSFQGMGEEGLKILAAIREEHNIPVVTEVMSQEQLPMVARYADVLQIGSRNMQNFELLKALGSAGKPILLKRGLCATIEEFVMAAEYIMACGNPEVILCERGIRSFDSSVTRNVLDLGAVVALKQLTHLPVIVDPSHAAGKREFVAALARAAVACGADGLIIECHPVPEESVSDARQALALHDMVELVHNLAAIAEAVGRNVRTPDRINRQFSIIESKSAGHPHTNKHKKVCVNAR